MKMNRRQFNTLAGLSAAGLVVPGLAQSEDPSASINEHVRRIKEHVHRGAPENGQELAPLGGQATS
jgi:hypothetical protein